MASKFDSAGWIFYVVSAGVLLLPCIYGASLIVRKDIDGTAFIGLGIIGALMFAGILTFVVNAALQLVAARRPATEPQRKTKRKKGKRK